MYSLITANNKLILYNLYKSQEIACDVSRTRNYSFGQMFVILKILFLYWNKCFNAQSDAITIMTQRVNWQPVTAETRFQTESNPRGTCSRKYYCDKFLFDYFSFPYQYLSIHVDTYQSSP